MHRAAFGLSALLAFAAAAACAPTKDTHGWVADKASETPIQPGVDTRATVLARMGTPSTTSLFDAQTQQSWYYISSVQERLAYFDPKTTQREVIVVKFGADDVVSTVDKYGLEKGRAIDYSDDKTPTRGRELGIIEQLFGNIGRTPPVLTDDEEGRNRR
jgi:outer membrane protein assembly factor BamE (lipoprotein component of BamABCDE complex)